MAADGAMSRQCSCRRLVQQRRGRPGLCNPPRQPRRRRGAWVQPDRPTERTAWRRDAADRSSGQEECSWPAAGRGEAEPRGPRETRSSAAAPGARPRGLGALRCAGRQSRSAERLAQVPMQGWVEGRLTQQLPNRATRAPESVFCSFFEAKYHVGWAQRRPSCSRAGAPPAP